MWGLLIACVGKYIPTYGHANSTYSRRLHTLNAAVTRNMRTCTYDAIRTNLSNSDGCVVGQSSTFSEEKDDVLYCRVYIRKQLDLPCGSRVGPASDPHFEPSSARCIQ